MLWDHSVIYVIGAMYPCHGDHSHGLPAVLSSLMPTALLLQHPAGALDSVNCKNYLCHFCPKQHLPAAIDLSPIKYVLNWRDDGMREHLIAGG
jgi:hypothetical protein